MSGLDPIEIEFCRRLRVVRMAQGLSLRDLGEKAGVGFNTIGRHERLIARPLLGTCERLAHALGYTVCSLLADEDVTAALDLLAEADAKKSRAAERVRG